MGEALVLPLKRIQGARSGSVRGPQELVETGAIDLSSVVQGIFEYTNHGLLKKYNLPLELILCKDW